MAHATKSFQRSRHSSRPVIENLEPRELLSAAVQNTVLLNTPSIAAIVSSSSETENFMPDVAGPTTTVLSSNATGNASIYGSSITFTATVTGNVPTGNVTFMDGNVTLGNGTAGANGTWTFQTSTLNAGDHDIAAVYDGDTNNATGNSTNDLDIDVSQKALTVTGITAANKTYDTTTAATLNTGNASLVGLVNGDTGNVVLDATEASGTFANANAGANKTVTISGLTLTGSVADNYTLTAPTATATISAKALTLTGVTATSKTYDGTTAATLDFSQGILGGVYASDDANVGLSTGNVNATFSSANVGNTLAITVTGLTLTGSAAADYSIAQPSGLTANITPKALTITGVTANNKTYDGTTKASLSNHAALSGVITTDSHNIKLVQTNVTGTFADASAAANKTVTITGFSLSGTAATNYTLTVPSPTATITPKTLKINHVTGENKTYDGTTTVTIDSGDATLSGVLTADLADVSIDSVTGVFNSANVGTNKITTTIVLTGSAAGDYTVSDPGISAKITAQALTITGITAINKTYDGTTDADLNTSNAVFSGLVTSDDGSIFFNLTNATGTFASKNAANGITVTIKGLTITGSAAKNYTLTQPASVTGNITPKAVTVTGITAGNKTYDGSVTASLFNSGITLNGVISNDHKTATLVTTNASGNFANANVGNAKVVTIAGLTLTGSAATNYTLTEPTAIANITPATLTVTGLTADKTYNGNTTATLTGNAALSGVLNADTGNVTLNSGNATVSNFSSANAGNYTLTVSGLTISGSAATNYTLTQPTITATISPKTITVSDITASNKTYNGTTSATIDTDSASLNNVVSGDLANLTLDTSAATGSFADANAGVGKTVTISGLVLTGSAAEDYTLGATTANATITPKALTVTGVTAANKTYDGTTADTLNISSAVVSGILASDLHNLSITSSTGNFASADAAGNITVTGNLTLSGSAAENYTAAISTSATITPAALTASDIAVANKTYDGTSSATLDLTDAQLNGVVGEDDVSLTGTTATYASASAAGNVAVTPSNLTLTGEQANNYTLTQPTDITGNITAKALTVTGITADDKGFDGNTSATIDVTEAELVGIVGEDNVVLNTGNATGAFANDGPGEDIPVNISGLTISGTSSTNYTLTQPTTTASIIDV